MLDCKQWTIPELQEVLHDLLNQKEALASRIDADSKELSRLRSDFTQELRALGSDTAARVARNAEVSPKLDAMQWDITVKRGELRDIKTAIAGVRGAIAYHVACKLHALLGNPETSLLKSYAGKPCGPKTRQKFFTELGAALGVTGTVYKSGDRVLIPMSLDCEVFASTALTDGNNRFMPYLGIQIPKDTFMGCYPVDWLEWAAAVRKCNAMIEQRFNEFVSWQNDEVAQLKIGDTMFRSVPSYTLTWRC